MAQSPEEIKGQLRDLLAEADRRKNRQAIGMAICACVAGLGSLGFAYSLLAESLGFGGFVAGLLACGAGLVALIPCALLDEVISSRRAAKLALRFQESFALASGDYGDALLLLKTVKSESEVEKDLLKALGENIQFSAGAPNGGSLPGPTKIGPGLLGSFDDLKPAKRKQAPKGREPLPLDPYGRGESSDAV